jgi:hypothetical protein
MNFELDEKIVMKTLLKVSIFFNLGLAGGLIFMLLNGQRWVVESAPQIVTETRTTVSKAAAATASASSSAEPEPFRWSQLDSKDYHVYVKNLRSIGCPEPTLRAIVSADVHAAYHQRIQALEQKLSVLANSPWSTRLAAYNSEQALEAELQQLPGAETAEIADLLGWQSSPAQAATLVDSSSHNQHQPLDRPVSAPLVLRDLDLTTLNLKPQQIQVINDVRQNFINEIGGPNQDPNDPAYLERWQKAQSAADDMLRGMLGTEFYLNYQLAAAENGQNPTATKP